MIVHTEFKQGSVEWMMARAGIPTASEFDALITPKGARRTGEMPKTYVAKKVAEVWQGGPLPTFQGNDMEQGQILESEAIPWYELEYGTVTRVGFITTDDKRTGCSPDGLLGEDGGIEIKCPEAHTHVKYLINGVLPDDYFAQVHGCMYVTGRKWWRFLSYRRGFPAFRLTVERDEKIQEAIALALDMFHADFDLAMERITAINGGPPRRVLSEIKTIKPKEPKQPFVSEMPS